MIKVRTKGLLFDMDGVLISSLGSVERSWQTWAEAPWTRCAGNDQDRARNARHRNRAHA